MTEREKDILATLEALIVFVEEHESEQEVLEHNLEWHDEDLCLLCHARDLVYAIKAGNDSWRV